MKKHVLMTGLAILGFIPAFSQSPVTFNARGLVVISDADLSASALSDGKLLRDNAVRDKLTAVKFPILREKSVGSVLVQNSVLTNANSIAVPTNGGIAFVLESSLRPEDAVTEYKDIWSESPAGAKLNVVDIINPANPKVKFAFGIGKNPTAIDIYKNELVIATKEAGKKLVFLETDPEGKPTRLVPLPIQIDSTLNLSDVAFHPSGDFVAATLEPSGEVVLFKILRENSKLKNIETVGKPVKVGDRPSFGRFSPDGKSYFVIDSKGATGKATVEAELISIAFAFDGAAEHKVGSKTPVGLNAGSFTFSPNGALIVVPSAGKSVAPWADASAGQGSQLTLLKAANGTATKVAAYPVDGILPLSAAFDKDGANLAVTVFEYTDFGSRNGGVEFWSVAAGDSPSLKKQNGKVSVERGAHTLRVIP